MYQTEQVSQIISHLSVHFGTREKALVPSCIPINAVTAHYYSTLNFTAGGQTISSNAITTCKVFFYGATFSRIFSHFRLMKASSSSSNLNRGCSFACTVPRYIWMIHCKIIRLRLVCTEQMFRCVVCL